MTQAMHFAALHNMLWWEAERIMQLGKWDQTVF